MIARIRVPPTMATMARLMRRCELFMRTSMFSVSGQWSVVSCPLQRTTDDGQRTSFFLDAARREAPQPLVGGKHTERDIVVKQRQVVDELLVESQAAGHAQEIRLRQEAVVEAHSAADAVAGGGETQAGDDDQVDELDGHGVSGD